MAAIPRVLLSKYLSARNCFTINARSYARLAHRNPVRVLSSEDAKNLNRRTLTFEEEQPTPTNDVKPFTKKTSSKAEGTKYETPKENLKTFNRVARQEKTQDSRQSYQSSRTSQEVKPHVSQKDRSKTKQVTIVQIPAIDSGNINLQVVTDKQIAERKLAGCMQNVKSSKSRKASGLIFLEGERLIADAIKSGLKTQALFVSRPEQLAKLGLPKDFSGDLYQVAYEKIQLWSELTTSPGLIGVFSLNNIKEVWSKTAQHIPLTLVCDNIRDPGNMGSLIRCGAAVGCRHIITTTECVDVWDSKVLRAAAGAHFRVNIELNLNWDVIAGNFVSEDSSVILADCIQKKNESHISPEEKACLTNLLAEEEASHGSVSASVEVLYDGGALRRDPSYLNNRLLKLYQKMPLPHASYSDIKLNEGQSAILVIGGETQGLSAGAHKLAHQYGGCKAFIPLENEVDSLNASVAAGILTYELRRKILASKSEKNKESPSS